MNETIEIRKGEELNINGLIHLLKEELDIQVDSLNVSQFPGGYSNLTYLLVINDHIKWVLRKPPKGANIKSGHDMSREFKILKALYPYYSKVPKPVHFCKNMDILGAEFYLMEKVDGWILRSDISQENIPSPVTMKHIFDVFADTFFELHQIDYRNVGLEELGNPDNYPERQILGWSKRYYQSKTDDFDSVDDLIKWLSSHIPLLSGAALIHNDFKYDNLILNESNHDVKAILDWEMSTIGDPLMDVGSSLGYWVNGDDPDWMQSIKLSPTTFPGNPTREGLLHTYALKSGKDPGNGVFYYAYGMLKLAVIAQQIYARYKVGHTSIPKFSGLNKVVEACSTMAIQAINRKRLDNLF